MGEASANEYYDADTLQVLCHAFEAAWQDIAGSLSGAAIEERRIRLALIILELARSGQRREQEIKALALDIMRRSQTPVVVRFERARISRRSGRVW